MANRRIMAQSLEQNSKRSIAPGQFGDPLKLSPGVFGRNLSDVDTDTDSDLDKGR